MGHSKNNRASASSGIFIKLCKAKRITLVNNIFQDFYVEDMVVHPEFSPANLFNDVALIFLNHEAKAGEGLNGIGMG